MFLCSVFFLWFIFLAKLVILCSWYFCYLGSELARLGAVICCTCVWFVSSYCSCLSCPILDSFLQELMYAITTFCKFSSINIE
ncbi:hypothetical protein EUGRSUZ_H01400 [Eucalyptus grandis]|uniref:Uncharacterized protein n=2 Tax=Eucalyptus grandis TaxID=71139 RepID=A0A059AYC3_EUCGR|nr:hypothetical protein EUGRSUZ_H01400 [Eucalyptus grandis]